MSSLVLSPRRLYTLVRSDVIGGTRSLILRFASGAGVVFVLFVLSSLVGGSPKFHTTVFPGLLLIGGYISTSFMFSELQSERRTIHFLSLPGSILEKYVGRALLATIGWAAAVLVGYIAVTAFGALVCQLIFGRTTPVFLPGAAWVWTTIGSYLVTDTLFIFGAVYFRKHPFLKTVLGLVIISLAISLFSAIAFRIVFTGVFDHFIPNAAEWQRVSNVMNALPEAFTRAVRTVGNIARWGLFPALFLALGYQRLRETEV